MTVRNPMHWKRPFNVPVQQRNHQNRSLFSLQDEMNTLFQNFFGDGALWNTNIEPLIPAIDIIESDKSFKIKAAAAGYNPDDIEVSIVDGFLTLKGAHKFKEEENNENYLRQEMSYGSFQRTVVLTETASHDQAEASFKNGILSIVIPKKAGAVQKPKKIRIKAA